MGIFSLIDIIGFCPIKLFVVPLTHKEKGRTFGQLLAQSLQAFAKALTIGPCPLSNFPLASGLYMLLLMTIEYQFSQRNDGLP